MQCPLLPKILGTSCTEAVVADNGGERASEDSPAAVLTSLQRHMVDAMGARRSIQDYSIPCGIVFQNICNWTIPTATHNSWAAMRHNFVIHRQWDGRFWGSSPKVILPPLKCIDHYVTTGMLTLTAPYTLFGSMLWIGFTLYAVQNSTTTFTCSENASLESNMLALCTNAKEKDSDLLILTRFQSSRPVTDNTRVLSLLFLCALAACDCLRHARHRYRR